MRRLRSIIWPFWPYDRFLCSQSLHGFVTNQDKVSQAYEIRVRNKYIPNEQRFIFWSERRTLTFVVGNEKRFKNRYSNIFQFRAYDRFLCSQSLHGIVRNQEKVSQAYETSVSKKRLHTKRTALHFVIGVMASALCYEIEN